MSGIPTLEELEGLIGRRVRYLEHYWQIIEVLDEEMALVLQADDDSERILSNAHGEPVRVLPELLTLPIRAGSEDQLNPELSRMEVLNEPKADH